MTNTPGAPGGVAAAELVISEIFGPTVQGEGPSLGRRAGFVRLGRCPLACQWCDSAYTWDWQRHDPAVELSRHSVDDVMNALDAMHVELVVITGGEPLLQQQALAALVGAIHTRGWHVEIETAGTIAPVDGALADRWNVSPKLSNSGMPLERRFKPAVLRQFEATRAAVFKFVATQVADLDEVQAMVDECALSDVWIMPEGTDAATVIARLATLTPAAVERGWNVTTRLHVLVWGDRRGV